MLMYTLAGIDLYHSAAPQSASVSIVPQMPGVALRPTLLGSKYNDALAPTGMAAQIAYKGWVDYIYARWEAHCRNEMKHVIESFIDDSIRPEINVLGDFRHIRNDFIHTGVATSEHSGRCLLLRWFAVGEPMVMTFNHVIDFLNQMGALTRMSRISDSGDMAVHFWNPTGNEEELGAWAPDARIVSVRAGDGPFDGSLGVGIAFENGVFGTIAFTFESGDAVYSDTTKIPSAEMSPDGKALLIASGNFSVPAPELYMKCLDMWLHPEQSQSGPGMWGPPLRFR